MLSCMNMIRMFGVVAMLMLSSLSANAQSVVCVDGECEQITQRVVQPRVFARVAQSVGAVRMVAQFNRESRPVIRLVRPFNGNRARPLARILGCR